MEIFINGGIIIDLRMQEILRQLLVLHNKIPLENDQITLIAVIYLSMVKTIVIGQRLKMIIYEVELRTTDQILFLSDNLLKIDNDRVQQDITFLVNENEINC
jgi:hypothetical protein